MKSLPYRLHLVTDRKSCRGHSLTEVVDQAIQGGIQLVQLREKSAETRDFVELAQTLKNLLAPHQIPLIINDRIDVALAISADGVHIGQSDMPYPIARAMLGPNKIIGLSVSTVPELLTANQLDATYLGVGPIYTTQTKPDAAKPLGINNLAQMRSLSDHCLIAIGGINANCINELFHAGVDGVAIVSAICSADSPKQAAHEIRQLIEKNVT